MATQEVALSVASQNAQRFFLPFRIAGQQRQQQTEAQASSSDGNRSGAQEVDHPSYSFPNIGHSPSSKTNEQMAAEIPDFLRNELRRHQPEEVDLSTLFFDEEYSYSSEVRSSCPTQSETSTREAALLLPGPFTTCILDMNHSTDSSSYTPSLRRDLPLQYDSVYTSSHSSISLEAYLAHCQGVHSALEPGPSSSLSNPWTSDQDSSLIPNGSKQRSSSRSSVATVYFDAASNATELCSQPQRSSSSSSLSTVSSLNPATQNSQSTPLHATGEVRGMLSFLAQQGKGRHLGSSLEVLDAVTLPLSGETIGWMQQASMSSNTQGTTSPVYRLQRNIPFNEQDDPPDCGVEELPWPLR